MDHAYLGLTSVIPNGTLDRRWPAFDHARADLLKDNPRMVVCNACRALLKALQTGEAMQTFAALTCLAAVLSAASSDARSLTGHERHLMQMAGENMQIFALES